MVVTGILGMNLFAHAELGVPERIAIFLAVLIPTIALTVYTVAISRRLATFMEALASERMTWTEKLEAFRQIWFSAKQARVQPVAGGEVPARRGARHVPGGDAAVHSSD